MSEINKIRLSGTDYDIRDVSATSVAQVTQQQYDDLPATAKTSNILYIITDAQAGDLTNYYTKTETNTLLGDKQDTLEAGRGISITTGETADTVSFNLPISAGTGTNSVAEGSGTTASGNQSHAEGSGTTASSYQCHAEGYDTKASGRCSHAEGSGTKASGDFSHAEGFSTTASGSQSHAEGLLTKASGNHSHAEGNWTTASGDYSHAEGRYTVTKNEAEHASGQYNVSNSATTTFGDSGNTLFSVGNGDADNARHNAFEIRQNGDIYLTKDGQDVKLQDQLGGGGSSYTAGDGIDITNDVISVTGKVDTSTYNTYTAATDTALASKQTTLTAGTGISIVDNVISATGGGGGKAVSGGTNISITTGETADTINCTLNLENGTNSQSGGIKLKSSVAGNAVSGRDACAFGGANQANGINSFVTGFYNAGNTNTAFVSGNKNQTTNGNETLFGLWALSNGSRTGDPNGYSDATLLAVGNGEWRSQTRHNAFEIRQNGDIYVPNTDDTSTANWYQKPMVRLQDTITATAANTTALGGLSLVKLTQSEYDALATKDNSTLYVIVN